MSVLVYKLCVIVSLFLYMMLIIINAIIIMDTFEKL